MRTPKIFSLTISSSIAVVLTSIVSLLGFFWPFILPPQSSGIAQHNQWFMWLALPLALLILITQLTSKKLDAKSIALLGVLVAVMAALRPLGAGAIGIEPMWFILIIAARVFGPGFGLILGITATFFSAFLTGGFGPWLAYQMFAAGWLGLLGGLLPKKIKGRAELAMLLAYGIFASFLFGLLMDLQFWPWAIGANTQLSFSPTASLSTNFAHFIIFHFSTSMAWDLPRAIFTSALILLAAPALLTAFRRTVKRANFLTPIEFRDLPITSHAMEERAI